MKSLIPSIWNRVQDWQGDQRIKEYVEAIQDHADQSDPVRSPDPVAFIYVFAIVLDQLVPRDVVQGCKGEIYEVMGELARIVVEEDGSSWPFSRKECVERACRHFGRVYLEDRDLVPKLLELVHTWNPEYNFTHGLLFPPITTSTE